MSISLSIKWITGIALFVQIAAAQTPQPATLAAVQGVVTEAGRTENVWGATVELRREGNPIPVYGAVTDPKGRFAFPGVQPGRYQLIATSPGYVPAEYGQRRMKGPGLPVTLTAGQQMNDVQIAMTPTGAISGRITDPSGQPLVLADVFALKSSYQEGQRILTQTLSAKTDERGEFRIFWLTPGLYYLDVVVPDGTGQFALITNADGADTSSTMVLNRNILRDVLSRPIGTGAAANEAHVPVYFPGTMNPQQAQVIDVRPGSDIRGITLSVGVVRTLSVKGVVLSGATAQLPTGAQGQAVLAPLDPSIPPNGVPVDASTGKFQINRVAPGQYMLYAQLRPGPQSTPAEAMWASIPIQVQDWDIEDISLTARPGVPLPGKVVVEGRPDNGGASPAAGLFLGMRPYPLVTQQAPSPSIRVSPDGTFTLPGIIAGNYRAYVIPLLNPSNPQLLSGLPPLPPGLQNTYVKSIRVGGADVLDNGVRLTSTEGASMEIVLGTNPGALEGRVMRGVEGRQEPASDITVGIVPYATVARGYRTDMHRTTLTDAEGRFQLPSLPPGDYKVFAWEHADKDAVMDLDFIASYEEKGTRVHIDDGDRQVVDVTMIPARQQ